jgi:hypothetical protein
VRTARARIRNAKGSDAILAAPVRLFPVSEASYALAAAQAACVLLPGAGLPARLARTRLARLSPVWTLVLPGSIVACVGGIALLPGTADALTYVALVAIPPLALLACAWAARGARPAAGLVAVALLAIAIAGSGTTADLAATALTTLSCVTLGRLLVAVAPHALTKVALVAMAAIDAYLVFGGGIDEPNNLLNAAAPALALPKLQTAFLDGASLGYGDLFTAAVFGALLAAEGRRQTAAAGASLVALVAFDWLFNYFDTLPATVPIAVVLVAWEAGAWWRGRRAGDAVAFGVRPELAAGGPAART